MELTLQRIQALTDRCTKAKDYIVTPLLNMDNQPIGYRAYAQGWQEVRSPRPSRWES